MLRREKSFDLIVPWACLLALGLGGCAETVSAADEVPVAVNSSALESTTYLHVKVFHVSAGFDDSRFRTKTLPEVNRLFSNTGIQFIYDGSEQAASTVCKDGDLSQITAEGNRHSDIIPLFFCDPATGVGSFTDNFVVWNFNVGLDHEIGHYLSLPHTFNYCWTASESEAYRLNFEDSMSATPVCTAFGGWKAVEEQLHGFMESAAMNCPGYDPETPRSLTCSLDAEAAEAARMRDEMLDGDDFSDTPPSLHVYPASILGPAAAIAETCAPGYKVPLTVRAGGRDWDFSFEVQPLRNRMDYFDCPPTPEGPEAYSPQQIAAMRNALRTTRKALKRN